MDQRKVTAKRDIGSGKWIKLVEVDYSSKSSEKILKWEMVERTTKPASGIDGVDVIAILDTQPVPKIILVSQFRPPLNAYCLELPAGLITEPNETPSSTALRELLEETGYHGSADDAEVFDELMYLDPGISNCNMKYVKIRVDPTDPRNINPIPQFQDEEQIKTHLLPFDSGLYDALVKLCKEMNLVLDARLGSIALGMKLKF